MAPVASVRRVFDRIGHRIRKGVVGAWLERRIGTTWFRDDADGFTKRAYRSYDDYLLHQRSKIERVDLQEYEKSFREALRTRLEAAGRLPKHASVLCLAARLGTEVKAFIDVGCFAIGIDLNPGADNRYVVVGDFHKLQFADESVDAIFTNSLDHAFQIDRLISEGHRVLKSGGYFIVEAIKGAADDSKPRFFESFWWDRIDDVISVFARNGFSIVNRSPISSPWEGEQLWLMKA